MCSRKKIRVFRSDCGPEALVRGSPFDGETPSLSPRGDIPPRVFLPRSCSSDPTGRSRQASRQATPRKQQQHDGVAHGSRAIHRGQGVSIKPFGVTPLSLIIENRLLLHYWVANLDPALGKHCSSSKNENRGCIF